MSLINDDDDSKPLEILRDFIERSTHWQEGGADRHAALKEALPALEDQIDWIKKGLAEWRDTALTNARHAKAAQATARVAIGHLQAVLNQPRTHDEQLRADTAARDWLTSIGSEPT